jgi:hypothetical protein
MTWTNSRNKTAVEENIFEMPTGGAAIMKQGPNLVYFVKEQCLALGSQLRAKFKINDYRVLDYCQVVRFNLFIRKMVCFPEK